MLGAGESVLKGGPKKVVPERQIIRDSAALESKLEEVRYKVAPGKHIPWVETLAITAAKPMEAVGANEDVKREDIFLQQSTY